MQNQFSHCLYLIQILYPPQGWNYIPHWLLLLLCFYIYSCNSKTLGPEACEHLKILCCIIKVSSKWRRIKGEANTNTRAILAISRLFRYWMPCRSSVVP